MENSKNTDNCKCCKMQPKGKVKKFLSFFIPNADENWLRYK